MTSFLLWLIILCNKSCCFRMLAKEDFSEIMMPTYKFRTLILPNPDFNSVHHNPFPNHYVHIVGIEDELTILTSLQRPRKIVLKGSDGRG